jgi:hypothetical protein
MEVIAAWVPHGGMKAIAAVCTYLLLIGRRHLGAILSEVPLKVDRGLGVFR